MLTVDTRSGIGTHLRRLVAVPAEAGGTYTHLWGSRSRTDIRNEDDLGSTFAICDGHEALIGPVVKVVYALASCLEKQEGRLLGGKECERCRKQI
jgi:hypothetical protein